MGPDGITRGSYSYLDDKGVQRTVQYIAGAGIGYRVVQTITGSGTHNLPRPTAPQFGVFSPQSNDLPPESLFFDDTPNRGFPSGTSPQGKDAPPTVDDDDDREPKKVDSGSSFASRGKTPSFDQNDTFSSRSPSRRPVDRTSPRRPFRPLVGALDPNAIVPETVGNRPPTPTPPTPPQRRFESRRQRPQHNVDLRPTAPPTTPSYPEYFSVNSVDFDKANIRAHVQNIDLLPISPRYPSPGDALKWDIISGN